MTKLVLEFKAIENDDKQDTTFFIPSQRQKKILIKVTLMIYFESIY